MPPGKKNTPEDEPSGAPQWMLTFCDCMTLMLTFFVMLFSFSCFDETIFLKFKAIFGRPQPAGATVEQGNRDAFLPRPHIELTEDIEPGSEFPTLARGREPKTIKEGPPKDFRREKVFSIPSAEVFWGKGTVISGRGRSLLATVARFMKQVPTRVVIGEGSPRRTADTTLRSGASLRSTSERSGELGLARAWAVMDYLTTKRGLDKKAFSISALTMLKAVPPRQAGAERERVLEITLLDRRIYR